MSSFTKIALNPALVPIGDADYSFDHNSTLYLVDPSGREVARFGHMSDPYMIAAKLFELFPVNGH